MDVFVLDVCRRESGRSLPWHDSNQTLISVLYSIQRVAFRRRLFFFLGERLTRLYLDGLLLIGLGDFISSAFRVSRFLSDLVSTLVLRKYSR